MNGEQKKVIPLRIPRWEACLDSQGRAIPHLVRYRKTNIVYVRKSFKKLGIPELFQSTGETKIGRAKTQAALLIQQWQNQHLGIKDDHVFHRKTGTTVGEAANAVLSHYTPTQRLGTQENHRLYLGELVRHWGTRSLDGISRSDFDSWLEGFKKTKQRKTFADYAKYMNLIFTYAHNERMCQHLIRFKVKDEKASQRVYTHRELEALWDHLCEDTRDQFVLCYECMMRLREVLHLTWDRVNLKSGVITLGAKDVKTGSKTGKGREFQMSPQAWERMRKRHAARDARSPFVFPSPTDLQKPVDQNKTAWRAAKKRAGIKGKARWHDLRHSGISHALLEAKMAPIEVSEYAGVSLRTIQAVYLHSTAEHTAKVANALRVGRKKQ